MLLNEENAKWLGKKLNGHNEVNSILFDKKTLLIKISRKKGQSFILCVISESDVKLSFIKKLMMYFHKIETDPHFIVNIPKEAYVEGDVFTYLDNAGINYGGIGDLYRFINQLTNTPYLNPEANFILRAVKQHSKVASINRIDSRRYLIRRWNLPEVRILALNDYDFGVESVRLGKEKYNKFDAILTSNPNARISLSARRVAKELNIKILKFGELLRELNFEWK